MNLFSAEEKKKKPNLSRTMEKLFLAVKSKEEVIDKDFTIN